MMDLKFFIGKINGFPSSNLLPWIGNSAGEPSRAADLSRYEESFNAANAESKIHDLIQPYLDARKELLPLLDSLTNNLSR
jgi:hypothetical protein